MQAMQLAAESGGTPRSLVGFLDSLTTNLDHSLPLSLGELTEFSDAKGNADHFKYIKSYSPYHNIKKI